MTESKLSLQKIHDLILKAGAVSIDHNTISVSCSLRAIAGDPDNEWLKLMWEDSNGRIYEIVITEQSAESAFVKEGALVLTAVDGDPVDLTVLEVRPITADELAVA